MLLSALGQFTYQHIWSVVENWSACGKTTQAQGEQNLQIVAGIQTRDLHPFLSPCPFTECLDRNRIAVVLSTGREREKGE